MERKIGEIFEYNGEWHQCVKGNGCEKCIFNKKKCYTFISDDDPIGYCEADKREDKQDVIFKKLEKVGEPYSDYCPTGRIIYFQRYRCYQKPIIEGNIIWHWADDTLIDIDIEIKQKQEDMKEKNLNLKPFDLEAAKAGKPVCTRDGRKARIICFDRDWDMHIVALVADPLGESVHYYLSNGKVDFDRQLDDDLMMLPEKKEGWVNVYYNKIDGITFSKHPHTSKEEAIKEAGGTLSGRIDTVKISWKE